MNNKKTHSIQADVRAGIPNGVSQQNLWYFGLENTREPSHQGMERLSQQASACRRIKRLAFRVRFCITHGMQKCGVCKTISRSSPINTLKILRQIFFLASRLEEKSSELLCFSWRLTPKSRLWDSGLTFVVGVSSYLISSEFYSSDGCPRYISNLMKQSNNQSNVN